MRLDLKELLIGRALHDCEGGGETVNNQHKVINENGVYSADSGYTGLGTVVVDVAQTGGGVNKLPQVVDKSVTEVTEEDLQGAAKIGKYAFNGCGDLETITIPESVTSIEHDAFLECWNLETIRVKGSTPPTLYSTEAFTDTKATIVVDAGCGNIYKNATIWCDISQPIKEEGGGVLPEGGEWLFKNEYIDGWRDDLPVPVEGVSYTVFVDGEEIGVGTVYEGEGWLDVRTEDFRVWITYQPGLGWNFHPIDSQVTSGTVSVRING